MAGLLDRWTVTKVSAAEKAHFNLVLLDDHDVVREGITARLSVDLPGAHWSYSGDSLRDAVNAARTHECDCAIVDLDLGDGTPVAKVISEFTSISVPVVVVSAMARPNMVQAAMIAGAQAFITKRSTMKDLAEAVRTVIGGGSWVPPDLAAEMLSSPTTVDLSDQERRALVLYASGLTLDMVARRMGLTPHTVKHYIDRVRDKYTAAGRPARTKVELHNVAREEGLIP
jgi:DNA-binding NarL/FixJ family response regulator